MTDAATLDEIEYDVDDLCDADDASDRWAAERLEARGEEPTAEAIGGEIAAYAEDCRAEEQIEEWKLERHRAEIAWMSRELRGLHLELVAVLRERRDSRRTAPRAREHRARRTARTASSRGDPDDPEPARGRRLAEPSRRAA